MSWSATIVVPNLDGPALVPMLEALTALNRRYLAEQWMPLYQSGVRYRREPHGVERWVTTPVAHQHGLADCEDLASWRAAELQMQGIDARAIALERPQRRGRLYHVVVRYPDGRIEDPSRNLGM